MEDRYGQVPKAAIFLTTAAAWGQTSSLPIQILANPGFDGMDELRPQ
jgi:hypothetical protein